MADLIIPKIKKLLHGGDYNPEQWPREIWQQDMHLMNRARFDVATVGVFSWSQLEPREGEFTFEWLDELLDLLHKKGRYAALATPSAAMPAWMSKKYPEVLRTSADGGRMRHGRRVNFCWSSSVYKEKVNAISEKLAERYRNHPALAFWHVSNEYGGRCHCGLCQSAFQEWLKEKFEGDLNALNRAYWTTYWSHTYTEWDQIEIPGVPYGEDFIMGLTVDWNRFSSDQVIKFLQYESAPLRRLSPNIPITTNLMGFFPDIDYHKLAEHVDFASWDSYPYFIDKPMELRDWARVSMAHDLTRSLKSKPFLLIESTPDSSNYYPVMLLKRPGMHALEGAQAIAHGSEGVMYFQWRKCRGSSEQYHGAVIGHDGSDQTRVYREVCGMGDQLEQWSALRGTTKTAEVALIYDWENAWAIQATFGPRETGKDYYQTVLDHYMPLWQQGVAVDIVSADAELSRYKVVIAPMLYMHKAGYATKLREFVSSGGTYVSTYWSAMVDENSLNFQGGFPGNLRDVFGIWVEETDSLYDSQVVNIQAVEGNSLWLEGDFKARQLCELVHLEGAEQIATYSSEFYSERACVTRNSFGLGEAYFVASRNSADFQSEFLKRVLLTAGVEPVFSEETPPGVTVQSRMDTNFEYLFFLNYNPHAVDIDFAPEVFLALDGSSSPNFMTLAPYGYLICKRLRAQQADNEKQASGRPNQKSFPVRLIGATQTPI